MSKRIVFFTKYSRMGASSRLRTFQYLPMYEQEGYSVTVSSLFSDAYLNRLYAGKSIVLQAFWGYIKRLFALSILFTRTNIIIEKELFPYLPAWIERLMKFLGIRYLVDYDDAIFVTYEKKYPKPFRRCMKNKIKHVMRSAEGVVVGNAYLAEYATKAAAKNVYVIPTVVDIERYFPAAEKRANDVVVIGWIGSPTTAAYVQRIIPLLEDLSQEHAIVLRMVGAKITYTGPLAVEFVPWTEDTEVASIQSFDIGVMPLEETEWARGKCAYKLIQYMACGVPSIGTDFGANREVISHGESGYLASNAEEWQAAFSQLIEDTSLRIRIGRQGRQTVEEEYSLHSAFQNWKKIMH